MPEWDHLQQLFEAAVDLPPDQQSRFLDSACAADPDLRRELEELLAADRHDIATLADAAVGDEADLLLGSPVTAGHRVGAYRIVRPIGRGGMGAVYLAVRDDDQFHKQVAIKIVKLGMDTAEVLSRFRHERQILANLDHPYIARLLDAGTTRDGRPFFVMDYVEGQPLDAFCRTRALSVTDRCRLFLRITEAVDYAHRNLVVHRDLKPANIFITADGLPKLLDFGVAKLLDADPESGVTITQGMMPLTPEYASPEQLAGKPVSTATDVYSLGAVLFELLNGRRASTPADVSSPAIHPGVDPDLDNIVRMAMRPEAERRYASVAEFADDLRRYLGAFPVRARKDSLAYRTRKFVQRRRLALTAAALIALTGMAGVAAVLLKAREAEFARRAAVRQQHVAESEHARAEAGRVLALQQSSRAEAEAQRARDRLAQMLDLSNRLLANIEEMQRHPPTLATRQQLTQGTLAFLEQLSTEAGNDERLRLSLATAYLRLGQDQADLQSVHPGGVAAALETLRKGSAVIAPLRASTSNPEIPQVWLQLQGETQKLLVERGQWREARNLISPALEFAAQLNRRAPTRNGIRAEASLRYGLAGTFEAASDFHQALQHTTRAFDSLQSLLRQYPEDADVLTDLSLVHTKLAFEHRTLGDVDQALQHHLQSTGIREQLVRRYPQEFTYRGNLMLAYEHLASFYSGPLAARPGAMDSAREYLHKAGSLAEASLLDSPNHPNQFHYADYLLLSAELGVVPTGQQDLLSGLQRAESLIASLSAAAPSILKYRRELCAIELVIGLQRFKAAQASEAAAAYRKALDFADSVLATLPADRFALTESLEAQTGLARSLAMSGDRPAALQAATRLVSRAQAGLTFAPDDKVRQSLLTEAQLTLASLQSPNTRD